MLDVRQGATPWFRSQTILNLWTDGKRLDIIERRTEKSQEDVLKESLIDYHKLVLFEVT